MSKGIGANCGTISAITEGLFGAIQKDILRSVLENKPKTDLMAKGVGLSNFRMELVESYRDPRAIAGPTEEGKQKWIEDQKGYWGKATEWGPMTKQISEMHPALGDVPLIGGMFRGSGYHNSQIVEPAISYNQAMNEKVVAHGNTRAVFGRDRMQGDCGLSRGYGGLGVRGAASIDLVAGPVSCFEKEEESVSGTGPDEPVKANPSPHFDASRLLLSQKCDADDAFNLANGNIGNVRGKAAAVLKSDCIRIIGRHSVKIVSGGVGQHTSDCKQILETHGIDLIAQNEKGLEDFSGKGTPPASIKKDIMQPLVLGDNLVEFLKELQDTQNRLVDTVSGLLTDLQQYGASVAMHTHGIKPLKADVALLSTAGEALAFSLGATAAPLNTAGVNLITATTALNASIDPATQVAAKALVFVGPAIQAASANLYQVQGQMTSFNTALNSLLLQLSTVPGATAEEGLAVGVPPGGMTAVTGVFNGAKAIQNIDNYNTLLTSVKENLDYLSKINSAKYICSKYNRTN